MNSSSMAQDTGSGFDYLQLSTTAVPATIPNPDYVSNAYQQGLFDGQRLAAWSMSSPGQGGICGGQALDKETPFK